MNENVARVVTNIAEYIGEFRMPERDQTLLAALKNGGDAVLLSAVVDSSESYSALSDRLLQYSNVDIREEEVRQAILMFSAGKDIREEDIADVVDQIQGHVGGVAHTAEYTHQMPPDKLRVTGLITGVDVEVEDLLRTKRIPNEGVVENVEDAKEDIEILRKVTATSDTEAAA
jgi:cell division GTPase FtsZ